MSGSMSKTEIEDVLSSIRRLVTEEQLQQQRPVARSSDKLVLTPALRIAPALPEAPQPLPTVTDLPPVPEQRVDPSASAAHRAAAALEAAFMAQRDDWEPEGTEPVLSLRSSVVWDFADESDSADMAGPAGPAPTREDFADLRAAAVELPAPAALPAELSAALPAELPAALPVDSTPEEDIFWDDYLAVHRSAPLLSAETALPWTPVQDPAAEQPVDPSASFAITEVPHGEVAAKTGPDPAPESPPQTVPTVTGTGQVETGQGDADLPEALPSDRSAAQDVFDSLPDDGPAAFPVQQDVAPGSDEALLLDLIRDVLREELRGDLGQRITRNVRKMVRAELARALTARDLT